MPPSSPRAVVPGPCWSPAAPGSSGAPWPNAWPRRPTAGSSSTTCTRRCTRRADRPAALPKAELVVADVTDADTWDQVLADLRPDLVVHLAAETGTAQSLGESSRHGLVNVVGTTQLLDGLTRSGHLPSHVVLTSSRAVYGEGTWRRADGIDVPARRTHPRPARSRRTGTSPTASTSPTPCSPPRRTRRASTARPSSRRSTCSRRGPARTTSRCRCCACRTSTAPGSR